VQEGADEGADACEDEEDDAAGNGDALDNDGGEDGNDEVIDNNDGEDDEGDASDEGHQSGITDDLLDWLDSHEGDDDQNSADEDDVAAADKAGAERKDDARDDDARDILSGDGSESISSFEQETSSDDITQTFSVTEPGDNASQCLNISPVANSGNAQNQIGGQPGGGNVEFNDVNFTLDVSGGSTVTCDQPINHAATGHALESGGDGDAWKLQSWLAGRVGPKTLSRLRIS
jgi:hypothetical protein